MGAVARAREARRRRGLTPVVRGGLMAAALAFTLGVAAVSRRGGAHVAAGARALLQDDDSIYPPEIFSVDELKDGAIVLHCIGMVYMFVALSKVCDEFFVPALEVIVDVLGIDEDVAGATFMAAGGSAPELATSILGVFSTSAVGFGTIVGSAVFNVLFVIGMCALFSKDLLVLTWWPLARDCSFYTVDLVVLYIFYRDQKIEWWEALIQFGLYGAYVTFMAFNVKVEYAFKKMIGAKLPSEDEEEDASAPKQTTAAVEEGTLTEARRASSLPEFGGNKRMTMMDMYRVKRDVYTGALQLMISHEAREATERPVQELKRFKTSVNLLMALARSHTLEVERQKTIEREQAEAAEAAKKEEAKDEKEDGEEEEEGIGLSWPSDGTPREKLEFLAMFPINATLWFIPDTRKEEKKKFFAVSFTCSILYISILSYWMVWWATTVGAVAGVDDVIMGYTVLAAGTSIPDLLTSVAVARMGLGDMAVSSSIGSNIFDVCFGLPVPWLLKCAVFGGPIEVQADSLGFSLVLLIAMLVAVVITIALSGWAMTKVLGGVMFGLYAVFLALVLLSEYGHISTDF